MNSQISKNKRNTWQGNSIEKERATRTQYTKGLGKHETNTQRSYKRPKRSLGGVAGNIRQGRDVVGKPHGLWGGNRQREV